MSHEAYLLLHGWEQLLNHSFCHIKQCVTINFLLYTKQNCIKSLNNITIFIIQTQLLLQNLLLLNLNNFIYVSCMGDRASTPLTGGSRMFL